MKQEPGKRIVSWQEFILSLFKKVISCILIAILVGYLAMVPSGVGAWAVYEGFSNSTDSQSFSELVAGIIALVIAFCIVIKGVRTVRHIVTEDEGVPLTRANTANLPASESLVRASEEPLQAQETVLLRAATETTQGQEAELLRASAGK